VGTSTGLTLDEFEQLPREPGKLELLDGELIRLPPARLRHMEIVHRLFAVLQRVAASQPRTGPVYMETGYKIGPGAWLQPDVSVAHHDQPRGDYLEHAPALAVEVVSERDSAERMDQKVKTYLSHGAAEVWLVYPLTQRVWVYQGGQALEFNAELRSALFPDAAINLAGIFEPSESASA